MLVTKTEPRTKIVVVEKHLYCDWCDTEIKEGAFETIEGLVMLRLGTNFPECGNTTTIKADLCENCFKCKLMPFLESNGCKMRTEESDW